METIKLVEIIRIGSISFPLGKGKSGMTTGYMEAVCSACKSKESCDPTDPTSYRTKTMSRVVGVTGSLTNSETCLLLKEEEFMDDLP